MQCKAAFQKCDKSQQAGRRGGGMARSDNPPPGTCPDYSGEPWNGLNLEEQVGVMGLRNGEKEKQIHL